MVIHAGTQNFRTVAPFLHGPSAHTKSRAAAAAAGAGGKKNQSDYISQGILRSIAEL